MLKEAEAGVPIAELCWRLGVTQDRSGAWREEREYVLW